MNPINLGREILYKILNFLTRAYVLFLGKRGDGMERAASSKERKKAAVAENKALLKHFWDEFVELYPTEEACREGLYSRAADDGSLNCRKCGKSLWQEGVSDRNVRCRNCSERNWITAGTFFEDARSIRPWFAAIWLLERGVVLSSSQLHELLDIAQSSAHNMLLKISAVMASYMLDHSTLVSSALFLESFRKRSRETPARMHPTVEEDEAHRTSNESCSQNTDQNCDSEPFSSKTGAADLQEQEKTVCDLLSGAPTHFDDLCQRALLRTGDVSSSLVMLELYGIATRLPGDFYALSRTEPNSGHAGGSISRKARADSGDGEHGTGNPQAHNDFVEFIDCFLKGISRKYVQNYLASYWCHLDRSCWRPGALLDACNQFHAISRREMLAYVSPLMVKFPAAHAQECS